MGPAQPKAEPQIINLVDLVSLPSSSSSTRHC
ncbi:hypothetical protein PIIN_11275 [Serendipita indica DSM 11827]|uniref:Uncharacterized protein n=1 Tax=Serendipita indica (strain DSM 11827) TaxID=1109443 RepID=G4U155_SERID|nr:hypothetical protein PIIN_11275 [Serendipita indica DSM 11827]